MLTLHNIIVCACENLLHIINVYDERITEPIISNVPKTLTYLSNTSHDEFNKTLNMFMNYIKTYRRSSTLRLEYITLQKHAMVLFGPQGQLCIGDKIIHNNKSAHIVDYLYQLDLYEIKYTDASPLGETCGWFRHTDFHSTNE